MNIVLCSTFRDSADYLHSYLERSFRLLETFEARGDTLRFLWGENDSVDNTAKLLRDVEGPATVLDISTGAPYFRSAESHGARWANCARYSNELLGHLSPDDEIVLWVECDLIWSPDTLMSIADLAAEKGVAAAPVFQPSGRFYDTFTTRKDGMKFGPNDPAWTGIVHVDSCAGAIAVRGDIARVARFSPDTCASWTRDMGGVWLDTNLRVIQP